MLFIVGMTRGGNTWLGKIFDAHPDVFYRHEPDSILKTKAFPAFCPHEEVDAYLPAARAYFRQAFNVRTSKAVGSFPVMPKTYHSVLQYRLKQAMVVGAKGFEKLGVFSRFFRDLPLPDMADLDDNRIRHVIKSIAALGQMNLFRRLYPQARIIVLLRHPGGQVHSAIKAINLNKIDGQRPATEDWGIYADLATTEQARREGLTLDVFKSLDPIERLAWRWAISNDKALEDLDGHSNVRVVLYEGLCADPIAVSQSLFDFAGLDWRPEVERFVSLSSAATDANTYDRVIRDSRKTAHRWRERLDARQIQMVESVLRCSRVGQFYLTDDRTDALAAE